jgi:hypothetical protein
MVGTNQRHLKKFGFQACHSCEERQSLRWCSCSSHIHLPGGEVEARGIPHAPQEGVYIMCTGADALIKETVRYRGHQAKRVGSALRFDARLLKSMIDAFDGVAR